MNLIGNKCDIKVLYFISGKQFTLTICGYFDCLSQAVSSELTAHLLRQSWWQPGLGARRSQRREEQHERSQRMEGQQREGSRGRGGRH